MIENIGAYSQVDYDKGYQQGRADGYSQAENDYFAQSQKDREDTYNCGYAIGRADAIDECKYNAELFREIFLEELINQSVDREEAIMYRNICEMSWSKYLEQIKENDK